jgi:hypothetical protein
VFFEILSHQNMETNSNQKNNPISNKIIALRFKKTNTVLYAKGLFRDKWEESAVCVFWVRACEWLFFTD